MKWKYDNIPDRETYILDGPGLMLIVDRPDGSPNWYYRCSNKFWSSPFNHSEYFIRLESKELDLAKKEAINRFNKRLSYIKEQVELMTEWSNSLEQNTVKD